MQINLIRHYLEKISRMKRIGLHMESKQLPLIEKCISLKSDSHLPKKIVLFASLIAL